VSHILNFIINIYQPIMIVSFRLNIMSLLEKINVPFDCAEYEKKKERRRDEIQNNTVFCRGKQYMYLSLYVIDVCLV
jgi:hypothetical protein